MSKIEVLAEKLNTSVDLISSKFDLVILYYQTKQIMTYIFILAFITFSCFFCSAIYKKYLEETKNSSNKLPTLIEIIAIVVAVFAFTFGLVGIINIYNTIILFTDPQSWLLIKIISHSK
jgi:hypothetical protein